MNKQPSDKEMRKLVKIARKSNISFKEWAEDNNVGIEPTANSIKRDSAIKALYKWIPVAATALIIAIILPVIIPLLIGHDDGEMPVYSSQDVDSQIITKDDLYAINGLLHFPYDFLIDVPVIYSVSAKDNSDLILSYNYNSCIITDNETFAFTLDYMARIYKNYLFYSHESYDKCRMTLQHNNITVYYLIERNENNGENQALINFRYSNIDYFLTVSEFEGITDVSEESIVLLLTELLK